MDFFDASYHELQAELARAKFRIADLEARAKEPCLCPKSAGLFCIFRLLSTPIFYKDVSGVYLECNKAFEDLLGLPRSAILGKTTQDISPQSYAQKYIDMDKALYAAGGVQTYESQIVDREGRVHSVIFVKKLVHDSQGRPLGLVGEILDISLQSEEKYRGMFNENAAIKLLVEAETCRIVEANPAAAAYYGYSLDVLTKMHTWDLNTLDKEAAKKAVECALKATRCLYQVRHKLASGELRDVEVFTGPIASNGKTYMFCIIQDITERKLAEARLRESEERYRELVENASSAILRLSPTGAINYSNSFAQSLFGYSEDELSGRDVISVLLEPGGASAKQLPEVLARMRADPEKPVQHECECLRKDGGRLWLNWTSKAVLGPDGEITQILCIGHDVSERKKTDALLAKLFRALEHSKASIVITDTEGHIEYVNPHFSETTGYSQEEALGQNPRILKSGEHSKEFYARMWETLIQGENWRGEICNRRKNGELYWEEAVISPVRDKDGRITHYVTVKEDITEKKKVQDKLKEALAELEALFDNSSIGIMYIKDGRKIKRVNQRFLEIFGYAESDVSCRSTRILHLDDEHFLDFGKNFYETLVSGQTIQTDYQLRRKNGKSLWCSIYGKALAPPRLEDGVIWIIDDISMRKELEDLQGDVERIMRHDLKSPLNSIIGMPQAMLLDQNLTPAQREGLKAIEDSGYRMLNQINLSLDLFKMETGTYQHTPALVDLTRLMLRLISDFRGKAEQKGLSIEFRVRGLPQDAAKPLYALADEMLCYTLLSNLLQNAIEASGRGESVRVELSEDSQARITLRNQGLVPLQIREDFFGKYVTLGKPKGTGLGTYSAKLMAEAQGGSISMSSSDPEGTCLRLSLPRPELTSG